MMSSSFGEKLKEVRKQHQYTQKNVAEALFVSRKTVSSWETGRNLPDIETVNRLAEYFGVTTDELLGRNKIKKTQIPSLIGVSVAILLTGRLTILAISAMLIFSDLWIAVLIGTWLLSKKLQISLKASMFSEVLLAVVMWSSAWQNLFSMDFSLQVVYVLAGLVMLIQPVRYLIKVKFNKLSSL
ncbi:helix-turn-helix transcriptional regulator [Pediococcus parvulus]